MSNVTGDERQLIDENGWRDFCAPECSCGGGNCWFEIKDRWVTYDITSWQWGTDPEVLNNTINEIVSSTKESLAWKAYPYDSMVRVMFFDKSLEKIRDILYDFNSFWAQVYASGFIDHGCYEYGMGENCDLITSNASYAYNKLSEKKGWLNRVIGQVNLLKDANNRTGTLVPQTAEDTAGSFYNANFPDQAEDSYINKVSVHKQRSDPYYPSVTAYGRAWLKSLFPGFLGVFPDKYGVDACGQGDTFYRDPATQPGPHTGPLNDIGKWAKAPPEACWQD
ncbi:MAG: hypothetical protein K6U74_04550 [Firmicutes bacterium]|nr:hypothetical protein [Bacillota bacterium]